MLVGWGPYAYFQVLEESLVSTQATNVENQQDATAEEVQMANQEEERSDNVGMHLACNASSTLEDMESGKR